MDPALVKRARQAANFLRTAPFTLCFDRLARFNGGPISYPIVITTEKTSHELDDVAAELHSSCRAMGITASRSTKVTPHVTLAHGPGFSEIRLLDKPILWNIDEITLIDSLQGKGRHVSLGNGRFRKTGSNELSISERNRSGFVRADKQQIGRLACHNG